MRSFREQSILTVRIGKFEPLREPIRKVLFSTDQFSHIIKLSTALHVAIDQPFLANDVTLVTSYGYCQSLKINDIRDTGTSVLRSVRLGGYSVRRWVIEGVHRDNETLTLSAAHTLTVYTMGESPGFEVFCIGEFRATGTIYFFFFAINRNYMYLMLLRMRCFVYFRSGRILFAMLSPAFTYT